MTLLTHDVIGLGFGAFIILSGAIVALIVLLSEPTTRAATELVLKYGFILLLVVGVLAFIVTCVYMDKSYRTHYMELTRAPNVVSQPAPRRPSAPAANGNSPEIVEQYETLMQSHTEQKTPAASPTASNKPHPPANAAKKADATKPLPAPGGKTAVGDGGKKAEQPALTLALSQGERGPDKTAAPPKTDKGPDKAAARPAWVDAQPQLLDGGQTYRTSITVGPYSTSLECDAHLPEELQKALDRYVDAYLGPETAGIVRLPTNYLREHLVLERWEEIRSFSVGPMTQLHVWLQFNRDVKNRILEEHQRAVVAQRLRAVTSWAAAGLSLLVVCFAYLKIDLATAGAYRGRLRLAAAAAILGLVCVAVIFAA
jgi:hypothetical protein